MTSTHTHSLAYLWKSLVFVGFYLFSHSHTHWHRHWHRHTRLIVSSQLCGCLRYLFIFGENIKVFLLPVIKISSRFSLSRASLARLLWLYPFHVACHTRARWLVKIRLRRVKWFVYNRWERVPVSSWHRSIVRLTREHIVRMTDPFSVELKSRIRCVRDRNWMSTRPRLSRKQCAITSHFVSRQSKMIYAAVDRSGHASTSSQLA